MTVRTEEVVCPGGVPAFLARPDGSARRPAIVLMHERYGLVQHAKDLARRCAEDGFVTIAPNFFFRGPDQKRLNAGDVRYDMSDPESVELIGAAISALDRYADMEKIAVAGYCQTGRHPLVYAAEHPIQAAVVWYGAAAKREWETNVLQPKALDDIIAALPCPIFGAFGSADHIISRDDVLKFRAALEHHGKSYDIRVYAGAPHGWLNDTMPGRYRKDQAEAAWAAQQAFLKSVFSGEWPENRIVWRFDGAFPADYDFSKNRRLE